MSNIFPIDFEEKLTMAQNDYILFSDSEDGNKIKKAQYKNLKGEPGTPGTPGKDGEDGAAATITVGSTTTGAAGSSASVTNSGTSSAAVFNFTIPQGAKGEPGEDGDDGAAATITVGTTTTLPAGSSATVTNSGTSSAAVLNFGIPQGEQGTGSGDVNGPASSTDGHLAVFDGATGKIIKDGGAIPEGVPAVGSNGQVLTVVSGVAAWANATGGSDIVYATQAEYNALLPGAASDGKHYFIYSTSGGGGWQPGVNTVAYYPLDSTNTVNDLSGNGNTLTTNTGVVFGTYGGVDCAYSNKVYLRGPVTNLPVGNSARTTSIWLYGLWLQSDQSGYLCYGYNGTAQRRAMITLNSGGQKVYLATAIADVMDGAFSTGQWYNIVATYDGTTASLYVNGQLGNSATTTLNTSNTDIYIGIENDAVKPGEWYLSNVIIENVAWTSQEVSDYFDLTKGDYGIS